MRSFLIWQPGTTTIPLAFARIYARNPNTQIHRLSKTIATLGQPYLLNRENCLK